MAHLHVNPIAVESCAEMMAAGDPAENAARTSHAMRVSAQRTAARQLAATTSVVTMGAAAHADCALMKRRAMTAPVSRRNVFPIVRAWRAGMMAVAAHVVIALRDWPARAENVWAPIHAKASAVNKARAVVFAMTPVTSRETAAMTIAMFAEIAMHYQTAPLPSVMMTTRAQTNLAPSSMSACTHLIPFLVTMEISALRSTNVATETACPALRSFAMTERAAPMIVASKKWAA